MNTSLYDVINERDILKNERILFMHVDGFRNILLYMYASNKMRKRV